MSLIKFCERLWFSRLNREPHNELKKDYETLIRLARRCAYDLCHTVDQIPADHYYIKTFGFDKRARYWVDLFAKGNPGKDYRHELMRDLKKQNGSWLSWCGIAEKTRSHSPNTSTWTIYRSNMATINIRQKGANGERELATELNTAINVVKMQLGMTITADAIVQRNQNQSAVGGCDLVGTFGFAIEVKRQEQLNINTWWAQCVKSAEHLDEEPVLIYRQNGKKWRVVMLCELPVPGVNRKRVQARCEISFEDFLEVFKAAVKDQFLFQLEGDQKPQNYDQGLFQ